MDKLKTLFYTNKHLLWLSMAVIIVAGITALNVMPRTEDPTITNRFAIITTLYPGASAKRIEALVVEPIENELRRAPEIKHLYSDATPGTAFIRVELKDNVKNPDEVFARLRDYIQDAKLPEGVQTPELDDTRTYAYTTLAAFIMNNPSVHKWALSKRMAEELASRLRSVNGTNKVTIYGAPQEEIQIDVNPHLLANLGLTLKQLAKRINAQDSKIAAGTINTRVNRLIVEVAGGFELIQRIRQLPIQAHNGSTIQLQDIASVQLSNKTPLGTLSYVDDKQAVLLAIRMQHKENINLWNDKTQKVINEFANTMPPDITLKTIFSQTEYTNARFDQLNQSINIGLISILLVLFYTLGWRGAFIVSLTLPLTIFFTLFGLHLLGIDLNQITVIGLVVALGIIIDNSIVVAEYIQQRRMLGESRLTAVASTISHLWLPLLGATITTVLAFIPMVLLPGPTGEFVDGIGYSVIIALIGSYFISHTIIASLAGRYLPDCSQHEWYQVGLKTPRLSNFFKTTLAWCLNNVEKSALLLLFISILGFITQFALTEQFFPASGRNQINLELYTNPSSDLEQTNNFVKQARKIIATHPQITQQVWQLGRSFPQYYYNLQQSKENNPAFAQAMLNVKNPNSIVTTIKQLQAQLDKHFPNVKVLVKKIDQGPPAAPIEFRITGPSLSYLQQLGDELRKRLNANPDIVHSHNTLEPGVPKLLVKLNEQQVNELGLSSKQLASEINSFIDGIVAANVIESTETVPVRVRLAKDYRQQLSDILQLPINLVTQSPNYHAAPLASIASIESIPAWRSISRFDNQRTNSIIGYVSADKLPAKVLSDIRQQLHQNRIHLPPGYEIKIGGKHEKRNESVGNLKKTMPLIAMLLFSVLVLTFRNMRLVTIILLIVMQSISMGLFSLFLSGYPFGFQVIVGLIGLVGFAINDSIVILCEIVAHPKAKRAVKGELINAVHMCLRHVFSTTLTTVAGFLPLMLSNDLFWPPFAFTLAGGIAFTTLLSIYWVPVLYRLFSRWPDLASVMASIWEKFNSLGLKSSRLQ